MPGDEICARWKVRLKSDIELHDPDFTRRRAAGNQYGKATRGGNSSSRH
jgi:hypothetical protein